MKSGTAFVVIIGLVVGCLSSPSEKRQLKQNIGTFWHVSDLHLDFYYNDQATNPKEVCPSSFETDVLNPGQWGDYKCDSPWKLVNSAVYAMKKINPNPDFIVWTGDDTLHTSDETKYLSEELVLNTIGNLTNLIKEAFPDTMVHASLGNHDYHPKSQMPEGTNRILQGVVEMWKDWMTQEQQQTFNSTGYYIVNPPEFPFLNVISLNSNLWYTSNKQVSGTGDPNQHFAWLREVLALTRQDNKKAYIIGHIPPGFFELVDYKYWYYEDYNEQYISIVRDYGDVIIGQFFGHHHTDTYRIFKNDKGDPVSSLLITPGVTPWMTTLPGADDGANNPGVRLFEFNRDTGEPLDYTQYMLDLAKANIDGVDNWYKEYRATESYKIPDLSPHSMNSLLEVMTNADVADSSSAETGILQNFALHNSVSYNKRPCDEVCQRLQVCSVAHVDFQPYYDCVNGAASLRSTGFAGAALVAFAVSFLCLRAHL